MNKDFKKALVIGAAFVAFIIIVTGFWGRWGMMGGFGGGLVGIGMGIVMLVFWGLTIWGIVLLVRGLTSGGGGESARQNDSAMEIIKRRYARGEINKEEYEEKKKDLL